MSTARPTPAGGWRRWHRLTSIAVAAPLLFYAVTGIALNHRQAFQYFQARTTVTRTVTPRPVEPLREFLAFYRDQLGRADDPAVIRIRGERQVEFLYGSHGQTTYTIDPVTGHLTETVKTPREPWATLNRLHQAAKTPGAWAWTADLLALGLLASLATGLAIPGAWQRSWRTLLGAAAAFAAVLGVSGGF